VTRSRRGRASGTALLTVGALGVVYGDIGTNPLFAMREAFRAHDIPITEANVLGVLSLILWSLILVISVKYITFVMRADNDGEGGILALVALISQRGSTERGRRRVLVLLGLFGAALLYGDGMITPSISVLAAVEGAEVAAPALERFAVPAAVVVLVLLFVWQRRGTAAVGNVFGPVMVVWFTTIGVLGAMHIVDRPGVFAAVNPLRALSFFGDNGSEGFLVLGAVILVVVGGEALYADMGHFGRRPIVIGWYSLVLPSLVLVYFGQGALLIENPAAIDNPFYRLAPEWALYPLVALATMATVIASQALISGAFSITHQAIELGYSPRTYVKHTSASHFGQIYVPSINWALMLACIALVVGFRESENLAGAYGLAVSATMLITTVLFSVVIRERFGIPSWMTRPLIALFLAIDLSFFVATLFKIPHGGWLPLVVGALIFTLMTTWRRGRLLLRRHRLRGAVPLREFVAGLGEPVRSPGTGIFLYSDPGATPPAVVDALRHHNSLHEQVLVVSVVTEGRPRVSPDRRVEMEDLGDGFHAVTLRFGFMEDPNVPRALRLRVAELLGLDMHEVTYFLGRESLRVTARPGMAKWREHLFAFMSRNAASAAYRFRLPPDQVFELGVIVEL
jgi:KUP system potassium uptake protein